MGKNQGVTRLSKGIKKTLTKSEISRGYFFVSSDKKLKEQLGTNFEVFVNGNYHKNASIDNSGRITLGKEFVQDTIGEKTVSVRCEDKVLHIDF